jgi:cation transport regulator ChaC
MWKTGFEFEEKQIGAINGWARRFWQGSSDHRGVPGAPGRVVTLIESPGERCCGMAYRIHTDSWQQTLEELDYREKGGYVRNKVQIELNDGSTVNGIVYHADTHNPEFLGPASQASIAEQIATSEGPSGSNKEYILQLDRTLKHHRIDDQHVSELADLVDRLTS